MDVMVWFKNQYTTPIGWVEDPLEWDEVPLGYPFCVSGTEAAINRFIAAADGALALDRFIVL